MKNILELKTINELQQHNFYIPSYQRGYRWTENEVKDLLNDISEFTPRLINDDTDEKTWYCLQPIVVKKKGNGYFEVIDGQQRLTTIYLILHYMNSRLREPEKTFDLNYETRENSKSFLKNLTKETYNESNIDFYHISNAYNTICKWFIKPNFNINDFESNFKFNSKVIWYESSEEDPIEIFTRINIGKIPLTNAELIKALFLNSSNFDKKKTDKIRLKQLEISSEWDNIEQSLRNNRFWYFLNGNNITTNRIEFIFDLMNDEKDFTDNYSTFRFFNKKFVKKNQETIENNWLEIKKYFQRFQEWFEERDLYHKIGYLIAIEAVTISDLYNKSINLTKTEFRVLLDNLIKNDLKNISLESLQYGDKRVKKVLLLYNILTMLNNENDNSYFPFDIYKNEKWDIEHITSITDSIPKQKINWLNDAKIFIDITKIDGQQLKDRADTCNYENDVEFESLFKDIVKHFNSYLEGEDVNDLSNLTLLDSETNRGYKNAVFPLKRKTIIDREKKGTFVPICTKNVFLKYFSSYPPKISFWTREDKENYYKDLEQILENYIEKDI
jgi:uncharacterized protein with ParB-like and HNH nuclease domain